LVRDIPCAIVRADFIHAWRAWLLKPGDAIRPSLDNGCFICEHAMLTVDLREAIDFTEDIAVVTMSEWEILKREYSAKPLIALKSVSETVDDDIQREDIIVEKPCCADCRRKSKLDFISTEITVITLKTKETVPSQCLSFGLCDKGAQIPPPSAANGLSSYATGNGTRQSRRIRENNRFGRRQKVSIRKDMTVKEIKIAIQKAMRTPVISQRLFYRGQELDSSDVSVTDLGILEGDMLFLKEADEDTIVLDSDGDEPVPKKKRIEGNAFGGTLLSAMSIVTPSKEATKPPMSSPTIPSPVFRNCHACTFENPSEYLVCNMCDAIL